MAGYRASPIYQAISAELDAAGISYNIERGRKHWRLIAEVAGKPFPFILSLSPSDHRAPANARTLARRVIRSAAA